MPLYCFRAVSVSRSMKYVKYYNTLSREQSKDQDLSLRII
jgi:hypothetical protein